MLTFGKLGLFSIAYLPLFLILFVKNFLNLLYMYILIAIALIGLIVWIPLIHQTKKNTRFTCTIISKEEQTKEALSYLIPYIISFIEFNLMDLRDLISFVILFIIIYAVFSNSNLVYINPILTLSRYRMYFITYVRTDSDQQHQCLVIAKSKVTLKKEMEIGLRNISDEIYLGEVIDNGNDAT